MTHASPTKEDLDRSLRRLVADKLDDMLRVRNRIAGEIPNAMNHSRYSVIVADEFDKIFRASLGDAIERAAAYVNRVATASELAAWVRPHIEKLREQGRLCKC
jgi:hypothetical protein